MSHPKRVTHFRKWAKAMVEGATVERPLDKGHSSKKSGTKLRRKRRRKRRSLRSLTKKE